MPLNSVAATEFQRAQIHTDLHGLDSLRSAARANRPEALSEVSRQFESMFLRTLLKVVRESGEGDPLFGSSQMDTYRGMLDDQMAQHISSNGGVGLAEVLERQLGGNQAAIGRRDRFAEPQSFDVAEQMERAFPAPERNPMMVGRIVRTPPAGATPAPAEAAVATTQPYQPAQTESARQVEREYDFSTPERFVASVWPHAEAAARELGTQPEVLVAQAALETGWGRHVIRRSDGESSHNLFNIKADRRWDGDRATVSTIEYRRGVAVRERAAFRAYDSFEDSFRDYVDFIKNSPRYSNALRQAANPEAYITELHRAGYATDPLYADKIKQIMRRGTLAAAVQAQAERA